MDMAQPLGSLQGGITSTQRLIDLCWSQREAPAELWPYQVSYRDGLSSTFALDALCLWQSPTLELKALIGQPIGFGVMTGNGQRRWLSGLISQVRMAGDEGGTVLIRLRVESALSLLGRRRTSRVFQDKSVPQIVAAILDEHRQNNPQIAADFDHARMLEGAYTPRSYCVQFNESDQQFIERLLAEEGISYRFEFEEGTPVHRLILSDTPLPEGEIDRVLHYRAQAATIGEEEQTLTAWQAQRQLIGSSIALASYDYQPAMSLQGFDSSIQQQGPAGMQAASTLGEYHAHTLYYGDNNSDMDHYARLRMQAQELQAKTFFGQGRLRNLATGQGFVLEDHPAHRMDALEQRSFVVTGLHLRVCNNLPQAWSVPKGLLTKMSLLPATEVDFVDGDLDPDDAAGSYRSHFSAVRRDIPLVPAYAGSLRKPTAKGPQIAQVVGPVGEEVYTDALGRIYIQPFWQRSQEHPAGTAEFNERSSTAVRVVMPSAGEGFGHQFVPRIGQEVLVDFLLGDIDRPVVVGVLYNGRHPTPAFSGANGLPGNRALSGIRSREHHGNDYSELLMDDTPGQVRARLAASPHASELNLGRLSTPRRDGEAQLRGDGAELRSDAAIAVRAATGLLLTTYGRIKAQGSHLDRQELLGLLEQFSELFRGLGQAANGRGADLVDSESMESLRRAINQWPAADAEDAGEPVMAFAAKAGLVTATPGGQSHFAGENYDIGAQQSLQMSSGRGMHLHAGKGINIYTQQDGINVISSKGALHMQAQSDDVIANAQANVRITATEGEVLIGAPTIRLVAEDGSYIRIGNGVEIGTSGKAVVHAATHDFNGPKTDRVQPPTQAGEQAPFAKQFALQSLDGSSLLGATVSVFKKLRREKLRTEVVSEHDDAELDTQDSAEAYYALAGFDAWTGIFSDDDEFDEDEPLVEGGRSQRGRRKRRRGASRRPAGRSQ